MKYLISVEFKYTPRPVSRPPDDSLVGAMEAMINSMTMLGHTNIETYEGDTTAPMTKASVDAFVKDKLTTLQELNETGGPLNRDGKPRFIITAKALAFSKFEVQ